MIMALPSSLSELPLLTQFFCGAIAVCGAYTDYRSGKIYNWLTFPALLIGLVLALISGFDSLLQSMQGCGVGFLIFFPLYLLGIMGAGDVKLMMAIGAFIGPASIASVSLVSLLTAGIGALFLLFYHKRQSEFFRQLLLFIRSLVVPGLAVQWPKLRTDITAPYGLAILSALIVQRWMPWL